MWLFFVIFIGLCSLTLMNLITAVILEQALDIVRRDEESQLAGVEAKDLQTRLLLRDIFLKIPRLLPDQITREEFQNAFKAQDTKWSLAALDFEEEQCEDL